MQSVRLKLILSFCFTVGVATLAFAVDEPPRSTDPRLKIELYAESPQIVTPTGIDVDHSGRVWAIESNTHFPPEGYQGHPSDRILVMEGKDKTGRTEKITVFKDGLTHSMSIAVKPVWLNLMESGRTGNREPSPGTNDEKASGLKAPTEVFIATRREILFCTDEDGDLKCDSTKQLVHLETAGNYPHNGLAGFAFDALGNMYFGFGENLGADYKIIGSDGKTLSGGGEGGNIYRCRPDGTRLEQWATGFWNPHASCFDAFGRLFTLDNDPDSRPPCRLLHIIEDGDYGYRFRNGRKGTHPFTAWNGEIPGTLPMVSGTGEAPSGIVCYESNGFPEEYVGTLLVGSWGDHRIDQFVLKPRGVSFESTPRPLIKGGENFRPVGLAVAPDGSLYVTDWVSKEYKLHGLGRVWRVSAVDAPKPASPETSVEAFEKLPTDAPILNLSTKLVERRVQARKLSESTDGRKFLVRLLNDKNASERSRIEALWALANVPVSVENLNLLNTRNDSGSFLNQLDTVSVAAFELLGTPQLSLPEPAPQNLFGKDLIESIRGALQPTAPDGNPWGAVIAIQVTEYYLKAGNLAGLAYMTFSRDPFLHTLVMKKLKRFGKTPALASLFQQMSSASGDDPYFVLFFLAGRSMNPKNVGLARLGLQSNSYAKRHAAVQWVGEEKLKELRPDVDKVLASEPMSGDLFLACLATLSLLDGVPPSEFEKAPPTQHILPIVLDAARPPALRAIALRILPPTLKELDGKLLGEFLTSTDAGLKREAVRTLALSRIPERGALLRRIASDRSIDKDLRADAIAGLVGVAHDGQPDIASRDTLFELASSDKEKSIRVEAIRSLRDVNKSAADGVSVDKSVVDSMTKLGSDLKNERVSDRTALSEAYEAANGRYRVRPVSEILTEFSPANNNPGNKDESVFDRPSVEAGRRMFFRINGAGCYKCHTVGGRGGQVGPDLTVIARTMDRRKLAESVLEPSKEISPQFTAWAIETVSGKTLTGMLLGEEVNGDLRLGNNQGEIFFIPFKEIETRSPLKTSIMPEKLHETMTASEFRDLIAFLETLK